MNTRSTAQEIDREVDALLMTLSVADDKSVVVRYIFDRLVELLVEQLFVDVRRRFMAGQLSRHEYVAELAQTIDQCRAVGLVPKATLRG